MRPMIALEILVKSLTSGKNAILWGEPGAGKTALAHEAIAIVRKEHDPDFGKVMLDLAMMADVDLNGTPRVHEDTTLWSPPAFWDEANKCSVALHKSPYWNGAIFADELAQGLPSTTNAFSVWLWARRIGQHPLPKGARFVAASNKQEHKANTNAIGTHLKTRFHTHINLDVEPEDWIAWANRNGIRPEVIALIRYKPELLMQFDAKAQTFPCPRTWEMASQWLDLDLSEAARTEAINGCLNVGAGSELIGFVRLYESLPTPKDILGSPESAKMPDDEPSSMYALTGLMSHLANESTIGQLAIYMDRMPSEFQRASFQSIIQKKPDMLETAWGVEKGVAFANATN